MNWKEHTRNMAYNESVKNNKIEESHQHWTGHSHVNTDLGSKGNAKDKGHKAKSKAFNYQGQDQGLEMSWSVVKIKANNDHKIYMHSEVLANTYDSKSLFNIFARGRLLHYS